MTKSIVALAVLLGAAGATEASELKAPADPVKAIEGEWTGIYDENKIRVEDGKVTLVHADPSKSWQKFQPGMVIGLLNNDGKTRNDGRSYVFSTSQCLVAFDHGRGPEFKMEPCGESGASLATYAKEYQLYVSGLGFRIPRSASQ